MDGFLIMQYIYWFTACTLIYVWGGYLVFLYLLSCFRKFTKDNNPNDLPVSIVLTVHNEECVLEKRVTNILETDYPEDLLEIVVASDGSTDNTERIVEEMCKKDNRIRLIKTEGGGKSSAQNQAIPSARGDIVILTDAEALFTRNTIPNLVNNFSVEKIGCVSGRVILGSKEGGVEQSQGLYWKFEMLLRELESRLGLLHTASGQVMAFRKKLFRQFNCIYGDDCIIPLDILLQGFHISHANDALAFDMFPSSISGELKTRTRMTLRNITCTFSKLELLNPFRFSLLSLSILSHKILRWLTPYFMIAFFVSNGILTAESNFFYTSFLLQTLIYWGGLIGFLAEKRNIHIPICSHIFSFLLANIGFFLGVLRALLGDKITQYQT